MGWIRSEIWLHFTAAMCRNLTSKSPPKWINNVILTFDQVSGQYWNGQKVFRSMIQAILCWLVTICFDTCLYLWLGLDQRQACQVNGMDQRWNLSGCRHQTRFASKNLKAMTVWQRGNMPLKVKRLNGYLPSLASSFKPASPLLQCVKMSSVQKNK